MKELKLREKKIFYNKRRNIKHIEYYDNQFACHEQPGPEGIWQWYRKDGSLKKIVLYNYDYDTDILVKRTIWLNKKGKITKDKISQSNSKKVYAK